MLGRRASTDEIDAALRRLYPSAPPALREAVLGDDRRPRKGEERVAPWVEEQVRRAAARLVADTTGLVGAAYPPDGEDGMRMYLPDEIADADVAAVPAEAWERARAEAWGDHGSLLAEDRELWWADQLAPDVDRELQAWRGAGSPGASG